MSDTLFLSILFIPIAFILLAWIKSGNFFNPVTIFNIWWGAFIFISTRNLAGLRMPTERAYILILFAVCTYSIGGISFLSPEKRKLDQKIIRSHSDLPVKLKIFIYFQILVTALLLFYTSRALSMLRNMDAGSFRALVFNESGIFGANRKYFMYFVLPSLYTNAFLCISLVFRGVLKKRYLIIALFNLILYSMVTVGRVPIFIAIMGFMFGLVYIMQVRKIKIKPAYVLAAATPVIFIFLMSVFRKSYMTATKSPLTIFAEYFIWYFTGPFTAFDHFLDFVRPGLEYHYSYFRAVYAGIEEIFYPISKRLFSGYSSVNDNIHDFTKIYRGLGGAATHHNSHFTMLLAFMWDAGIYGVLIFPFIFGSIVSSVYNNFRKFHRTTTLAALLLLTYLSLMGIMRWELRYIWSWMTLFMIFFFAKKFILKPELITDEQRKTDA
jgi:oligosaccharide repeat unit polymerase